MTDTQKDILAQATPRPWSAGTMPSNEGSIALMSENGRVGTIDGVEEPAVRLNKHEAAHLAALPGRANLVLVLAAVNNIQGLLVAAERLTKQKDAWAQEPEDELVDAECLGVLLVLIEPLRAAIQSTREALKGDRPDDHTP